MSETLKVHVRLPRDLAVRLDETCDRLVMGRDKLMVIAIEDLLARLDKLEGRK